MSNVVKIDRSSIKSNPNAGATSGTHPLPAECTARVAKGAGIAGYVSVGPITESWGDEVEVSGNFQMTQARNWPSGLDPTPRAMTFKRSDCEISFPQMTSHWTHPEPDWLYKYEDSVVTCPDGHNSRVSELREVDDDENFKTDYVCPVCDEPVELEHEKIEGVVKEMGLK